MSTNRCNLGLLAVIVLAVAVASCGSSAGEPRLSMKLIEDEVTLHEPVVVEIRFRNPTADSVELDLGVAEVEELEFVIVSGEGGKAERIAPTLGPMEWHTGGKIKVGPGEVYRSRVLLNRWFVISSAGAYEVVGEFTGTVTRADSTHVQVQRRFVLPLRVLPRSPKRLQEIADELAQKACQSRDLGAAYEAAEALARIEDAVVVPFLAKLLGCDYTAQVIAVGALGRIKAPEAIAALLTAAETDDPSLAELVRLGLGSQMQRYGSEIPLDLRRRIEEVISSGASVDDAERGEP